MQEKNDRYVGISSSKAVDEALWKSYLLGDEDAFKSLYDRFYTILYHYAYGFDHDRDHIVECIQDLFVKLWRNRSNLSQPPSVKHYLFKALRNILYNKQIQRKNEVYVGGMDTLALLNEQSYSELHFRNTTPLSPEMEQYLKKLTNKQREAIYLYYVEDFSYKELGLHFKMRTEAAYKLIYRALEALKQALGR